MDKPASGDNSNSNSSSSRSVESRDPKYILQIENEELFDSNAVSLSSAVIVSEDNGDAVAEPETELTFSNDLLIIAPPQASRSRSQDRDGHGDKSPSTTSMQVDSNLIIPPFATSKKSTSRSRSERTRSTGDRGKQLKSGKSGSDADSSSSSSSLFGSNSKMPPKLSVCSDDDELDTLLKNREQGTPKNEKSKYFGFTRKQWLMLSIFGTVQLFATTVISLQAPFYPKEAELKGATATEYGLVFGIFQLTMFFMCPVFGSIVGSKINPRLMFNVGISITGTCALAFGFLDYIEDRVTFIALSFALRIIQACGDAAFVTASFTIIALEFPESVATTFAALETCSGVGLIIGPTVGGALFEVGGFLLPFVSMGGLLFTLAILTYFLLPEVTCVQENGENEKTPSGSGGFGFISLIRLPSVALAAFSITVSSSSIGFLAATLEPHLRKTFGLTPFYTGLVFIISGAAYAISAPIWGKLCDRGSQPKLITLVGCLLSFTGFLFIGPAPFIPLETILWLTCIGLVINGLGVGATLVSAFVQGLQDAIHSGFPDSVSTYGLLSGMWTSSFALGCFIGPSLGGVLLDNYGFRMGSIYVLATQVLVAFLVVIFICVAKTSSDPTEAENNRLLPNSDISFNSFNDELKKQQSVPGVSNPKSYGAV